MRENGAFSFFTPASAYAFMVFNLFSAPCFGAIGAMRRELGSTKKLLKAIAFQTALAWLLATFIYQIGNRIEKGIFNIVDIAFIEVIASLVILIVRALVKKNKNECVRCAYYKNCIK